MKYEEASKIVHADRDLNDSALLFVRLAKQAKYAPTELPIIEDMFWSTLILAFIRGYNTRKAIEEDALRMIKTH